MTDPVVALHAVIAVRPVALGKRRLAASIADADRRALIVAMLEDVLTATAAAMAAGSIAAIRVIGGDDDTDAIAARHGATTRRDDGDGFSAAVAQGIAAASADGADAVLVLPADLPLIDADAIRALRARLPAGPALVIAPDGNRMGTNAVLLAPPQAMPLTFDGRSFEPHRAAARARGLALAVVERDTLTLDIDSLEDLHRLAAHPDSGRSRAAAVARRVLESDDTTEETHP